MTTTKQRRQGGRCASPFPHALLLVGGPSEVVTSGNVQVGEVRTRCVVEGLLQGWPSSTERFGERQNTSGGGEGRADQVGRKRYPIPDGFAVSLVGPYAHSPSASFDFSRGPGVAKQPKEQHSNKKKES